MRKVQVQGLLPSVVSSALTRLSYSPAKSEYVVYKEDGVDKLPDMSTYIVETEYVDEIVTHSNGYDDDRMNKPSKSLKFDYPFG